MAGATPTLKIGQGFGTWLIPIIIFGVLGSAAVASLAFLVCIYSCRPRRKITDWEPETTHESYRTPTIPYKHPSHDRPVDSTIGRLVTHSRSLHVVSQFISVPNRRVLIFTSLATKRSMHTVSDPKSALENYATLLNLHHTHIERHLYPPFADIQGHKVKYTLTKSLTPNTHVLSLSNPNNCLHLPRTCPHDQKDVSLFLHQAHIPQVVCLWME